jgi:hypothetical protein
VFERKSFSCKIEGALAEFKTLAKERKTTKSAGSRKESNSAEINDLFCGKEEELTLRGISRLLRSIMMMSQKEGTALERACASSYS